MNDRILVHASDAQYREAFLFFAGLESCAEKEITCHWQAGSRPLREDDQLHHMIVMDGLSLILLPLRVTSLRGNGFTADMPEKGHLIGKRSARRHACRGILAELLQNGFLARGELIDFSPLAFRVRMTAEAGGSFIWLNGDAMCTIRLQEGKRTLFSGSCRCIRHTGSIMERELVLAPLQREVRRFRKKKARAPRLQVKPPPVARFDHPLFGKPIQRDICDLALTGFSVEEEAEDGVLMPGTVIPDLEIRHAGAPRMTCTVQVVYRRESGKGLVRCGLAILDMDFRTYSRLGCILVRTEDPMACISGEVDMDALWEFFFDAGFIYPQKYYFLQPHRKEFKETYRKLYQENHNIASHFTYEENGRIYGHVSMIRAYQRAWMIHHLAARPRHGRRTGLSVLKHILQFFDGLYRYPSIRMDHMIFYFRPENLFPDLFFGGFARDFRNPRGCSLDLFAYINHPTGITPLPLPAGWRLVDFASQHLPALERFYRNTSQGLLLDVLRLGHADDQDEPVEQTYQQHGFLRSWSVHSLLKEDELKAVLIVNRSDLGVNLSELLNSIKIIVTDSAGLPWEILSSTLACLTSVYPAENVPLLIYPASYPMNWGIHPDKHYQMWIMDSQYGREYREYMQNKTRMTLRFLAKYILRKIVPK